MNGYDTNFVNATAGGVNNLDTTKYDKNIGLINRYQNGEAYLIQEIIDLNMGLVNHIIKKYYYVSQGTIGKDELESAGIIGLLDSIKDFDGSLGNAFSTFAYYRILNEIQISIANSLGIKVGLLKDIIAIKALINKRMSTIENYEIDYKEVSDFMNISLSRVISIVNDIGNTLEFQGLSYDMYPDQLTDGMNEKEDNIKLGTNVLSIGSIFNSNERIILSSRLFPLDGHEKTLEQIGDELSLSKERIRVIEKKGIQKLTGAYLLARVLESEFNTNSLTDYSAREIDFVIINFKYIYYLLNFNKKQRAFFEGKYINKLEVSVLKELLGIDYVKNFELGLSEKIYDFIEVGRQLLDYYGKNFIEKANMDIKQEHLKTHPNLEIINSLDEDIVNKLNNSVEKEVVNMIFGVGCGKKTVLDVSIELGITEFEVISIVREGIYNLKKLK